MIVPSCFLMIVGEAGATGLVTIVELALAIEMEEEARKGGAEVQGGNFLRTHCIPHCW